MVCRSTDFLQEIGGIVFSSPHFSPEGLLIDVVSVFETFPDFSRERRVVAIVCSGLRFGSGEPFARKSMISSVFG